MRILVLTHNYPRFAGDPAGFYVARLAEAAAGAGHEVQVLAPHVRGTPAEERGPGGLLVRRFRYAPDALERVGYRGDVRSRTLFAPLTLLLLPFFLNAFRRQARWMEREFRPDVVHAHWWFPAGWIAARLGTPYLVTSHGSDARLLDRGSWFRAMARPVYRRAARVTTASRFLAADLERRVGPLSHPVHVTPMPVEVERFARGVDAPRAAPPRILYAGNLVPGKGVDVLLAAAGELKRRGTSFRIRILGEGPELGPLRALAERQGIAGDVEWSPFVSRDAMPAEYGAATVTVLPSRGQAEGLGLTLVEALLAGSAVVGTPAGGIPEVVEDGVTGFLARDGDAAHLAERLGQLLADASLRRRLVTAGAERMRDTYAPAAAAGRFFELYQAVAERR
ncbi:MAG TPA: glycosyltransferase [Gemmatimonadales bacterium]|nr:glycosyltransferase [Gemmatimonadales bacterium]